MSQHTPEPWREGKAGGVVADTPIEGGLMGSADVEYYGGHLIAESCTKANVARIVACVNACKGLTNEQLEKDTKLDSRSMWRGKFLPEMSRFELIEALQSMGKALHEQGERHRDDLKRLGG